MFEFLKAQFDKLNEVVLGFFLLVASGLTLMYSLHNALTDLQVVSFIGVKVSLYIFLGALFMRFLGGLCFNVSNEIFKEDNIAAAVFVGLSWVGLAIAIAAGNLG
jgi:hypothetical protein